MLSRNPAFSSSPQPEYCPSHSLPVRSLRPSSNQIAVADGYGSPRQQLEKRVVATPSPPSQPSQQHQHQHQQPSFNSPGPSLPPLQEYHSGFSNEDISSPSPYSPTNQHRRQQSFPNLLPL